MTVYALIPDFKVAFLDNSGNPASGYKLFVYTAGTSTKATTYQDAAGVSTNTNPIVLNARGELPYGLYVAHGTYKLVFTSSTDTDPPGSPIWTRDNLTPINDTASVPAVQEWIALGVTPTYISSTQFSVPGNLTGTLTVGRRLQTTNSGGTGYHRITASSFGAGVTTVSAAFVTGAAIDAGLSAVNYGLLNSTSESIPDLDSEVRAITQAVNSADTHIATTAFVNQAKVGADRVLIADATNAAAAADVHFTDLSATYDYYEIEIEGCTNGTNNTDLWLQISLDNGGTYKAGGSDYRHNRNYSDSSPTGSSTGANSDTKIVLAASCYCTGGTSICGIVRIHQPNNTNIFKPIKSEISYFTNAVSAYAAQSLSTGYYIGALTAINAVRILFSSGTISGKFKIWGIRTV